MSIAPENMILDYFDGLTLAWGHEKINVVCVAKNDLIELVSTFTDELLNISSITIEEFAFASLLPLQQDAVLLVCQQPNEEINLLISWVYFPAARRMVQKPFGLKITKSN